MEKVSTVAKMPGGNQTELYQGNVHELKVLKARSVEELWPQYVKTGLRFGRPYHSVRWETFEQKLQRCPSVNWARLDAVDNYGMELTEVKPVKSAELKRLLVSERNH